MNRTWRSRKSEVIIVVLVIVVALQLLNAVWTSIQTTMANEQTEVFCELVEDATKALEKKPPDVKRAMELLDYVHSYYPSGTKQKSGSALDRIVERARLQAEGQIVGTLRSVTGKDYGSSAEAWLSGLKTEDEANN
jgi:hypothetical protein